MRCKTIITVLTVFLFTFNSPQLFPQSGHDSISPETITSSAAGIHQPHESTLERLFMESRLYDYLLTHPGFIKIQDMAQRVWENQTRVKRRVSHAPRSNILPRRTRRVLE